MSDHRVKERPLGDPFPLNHVELRAVRADERAGWLDRLSDREAVALLYDRQFWARPSQIAPPGNWRVWLVLAGRGFGKTRMGAEWVRSMAEGGTAPRIALVGETAADVRDVMIEGESGLMSCCPPWARPKYEPSKRRLTWPNGVVASTYSADDPDQLRGPQFAAAWADEVAKWRYGEAWDNLLMGLRLGKDPRVIATTTPRPRAWLTALIAEPSTVITRGATAENKTNLAPGFLDQIVGRYKGTRLGRQELDGEYLTSSPDALWRREEIEAARILPRDMPVLARIVVAVDPAVTAKPGSDETGIIVIGASDVGTYFVLEDLSGRRSPNDWARTAVGAYCRWRADHIVTEVNQGGDLVPNLIHGLDGTARVRPVRASKGKYVRAEPIAALYERGLVHHVGHFTALEDQMCGFGPSLSFEGSPDRLDALVWGLTALSEGRHTARDVEVLF